MQPELYRAHTDSLPNLNRAHTASAPVRNRKCFGNFNVDWHRVFEGGPTSTMVDTLTAATSIYAAHYAAPLPST